MAQETPANPPVDTPASTQGGEQDPLRCECVRRAADGFEASPVVGDTSANPTLLFVHGAAGSARDWSVDWMNRCAAHGWSTAAISLRGHGKSPGADRLNRWSLSNYVNDVSRVFHLLEKETGIPPILVGHSMGTLIVQRCLSTCNASQAVLLAPVGALGSWYGLGRMLLHNPLDLLRVSFCLGERSPIRKKWYLFSDNMDDALARQLGDLGGKESILAHLAMLWPSRMSHVNIPVHVIGAANDRLVSKAALKRTAAFYGTEPIIIDDIAHHLMLDTRWENAADLMLDRLVAAKCHA